jgi:hypothetical protein
MPPLATGLNPVADQPIPKDVNKQAVAAARSR